MSSEPQNIEILWEGIVQVLSRRIRYENEIDFDGRAILTDSEIAYWNGLTEAIVILRELAQECEDS